MEQGVDFSAKLELATITSDLMPAGKPNYLGMIKYPMIRDLIQEHGKQALIKAIFLLIRDFCTSMNVVRNMTEDQMIEAAAMLVDECDNFRLEDYTMMFTMAKRGALVDIRDRIDIQMITKIMDEYWSRRREQGYRAQVEEVQHLDTIGDQTRSIEAVNPGKARMIEGFDGLQAGLQAIRDTLQSNKIEPKTKK